MQWIYNSFIYFLCPFVPHLSLFPNVVDDRAFVIISLTLLMVEVWMKCYEDIVEIS